MNKGMRPKLNTRPQSQSAALLFDDGDSGFKQSKEASEYTKAYQGLPTKLDKLNYRSSTKKKKNKGNGKYKFDNYIEGEDISPNWTEEQISARMQMPEQSATENDDHIFGEDKEEVITVDWKQIYSREKEISPPFAIQARTKPIVSSVASCVRAKSTEEQDDEKVYFALTMAKDIAKKKNLKIIGGAICQYNGQFFTHLSEDGLCELIYNTYYREISYMNPLPVIRNVVGLLRYCIEERIEEFPVNSDIIVFKNGTLEINNRHFRLNSPKDTANSALGINFDPRRRDMPHTQYFLQTIADGDSNLYELMLQVIGYILSNDIKAKSFFYLEGVGDAGKSRFCDLIASFFPTTGANKVARIALQDLDGKFALGNLVNAKLNISEDLPNNPLSPKTVSRIKMLSDSNRLEAEAKYVQAFSFKPLCKLLFASNHPLRLKEYDAAFINRVVYIPFKHPIPKQKQDKDILRKMQSELPALFNHAFTAYQRLVANGYVWAGADQFKPEICVVNSGISIDRELTLRRFVETCCICGEGYTTSVSEMQERYQDFCRKQGRVPIAGDRFSRELFSVLPDTVVRTKMGNQRRGFKGIKLKEF